jgi:hypothetical protein
LVLSCLLIAAQPVLADGSGPEPVVGQDYVLAPGQTMSHDLAVVGGKLTLQAGSLVRGSVAAMGGNVVAAGHITGDLVVLGGSLDLADTAIVDGDIVTLGAINRSPGAIVRGQIVTGIEVSRNLGALDRLASISSPVQSSRWLNVILSVFGAIFMVCLVVVLVTILAAIWPEKIKTVGIAMRANWLQCLGAGLLTLLVVVILVPILVVICIGIPVAVVLLLGLAASGLVGWAASGKYVGERALQVLNIKASPLVQTLSGAALITLLAMIPCLGALMAVIVVSIGIGAVFLTRFGTRSFPQPVIQGNGTGVLPVSTDSGITKPVNPGGQSNPEQ